MSLDEKQRIRVTSTFTVPVDGGLPLEILNGRPLAVSARGHAPAAMYSEWHRKNVYLG